MFVDLTGRFQPPNSLPRSILACLKVLQELPIEYTELPVEGPEHPVEGEILTRCDQILGKGSGHGGSVCEG